MVLGAIAGMLWGYVLTYFSLLPSPLNGMVDDQPRGPDIFYMPSMFGMILFGIGGIASAEMFRRWMLAELPT